MRDITRRAWNHGLENTNGLLSWMYDKEILNKGDRAKKDSIFRQYYRYYNDGDAPRGVLRKYGVSMYQKTLVEQKLELYVNDYIASMLKKYAGKYDRKDFYLSRKITTLKELLHSVENSDAYVTLYWAEKTKHANVIAQAKQIDIHYKIVRGTFNQSNPDSESLTLSWAMNQEGAVVTEFFKESYQTLTEAMIDFAVSIKHEIALVEAQVAKRKI